MLLIDIFRYLKRRTDRRPVYLKNFVDQSHHHGNKTSEPSVSIIIPTRDKVELLSACVESIFEKTTYENYQVIVVDNQSVDSATHAYLGELEKRGVKILKYPHKFNYSAICNLAAENATTEYICFLNNDTVVLNEEWLESLVEHATLAKIGLVGSSLKYSDGTVQHLGVAKHLGGVAEHVFRGLDYSSLGRELTCSCFSVTAVTFAAALVSRSVYKNLGGLDESFRVGFNDLDFALRARKEGYEVVVCNNARLVHLESQTRSAIATFKGFSRAAIETLKILLKHPEVGEQDAFFSR